MYANYNSIIKDNLLFKVGLKATDMNISPKKIHKLLISE